MHPPENLSPSVKGRGPYGTLRPPGKRPCLFCKKSVQWIDYKDYPTLKKYTNYFGNIKKRYYTGVCLRHQKMLKRAVERARFMAILSYRK
jgi:small subunit ribosomal protein S18